MEEIARIFHPSLETPLVLSPSAVQVLAVEAPREFYRLVGSLDAQLGGGEGDFSFLRDGKEISPEKEGTIVCDLFHFDLNEKKVVNLLLKRLSELSREGTLQYALSEINGKIEQYLFEVFSALPFSLTHDELTAEELFKGENVRFEKTYDTLLEKIVCYINAMIALKNCRFFVFVHLKTTLDDEELRALYHHCEMEKVGLLLLEYGTPRPLLSEERAIIITEDLCEILVNYGEM